MTKIDEKTALLDEKEPPEKKIKIENNNFCPCGTEVGILRSGLLRSGQEF